MSKPMSNPENLLPDPNHIAWNCAYRRVGNLYSPLVRLVDQALVDAASLPAEELKPRPGKETLEEARERLIDAIIRRIIDPLRHDQHRLLVYLLSLGHGEADLAGRVLGDPGFLIQRVSQSA